MQILVRVCNLEALDDHNISPLFLAAQYGKQECLEILVNAGEYVISLYLFSILLLQIGVGKRSFPLLFPRSYFLFYQIITCLT